MFIVHPSKMKRQNRSKFWIIETEQELVKILVKLYENKRTIQNIISEWKKKQSKQKFNPDHLYTTTDHLCYHTSDKQNIEDLKQRIENTTKEIFTIDRYIRKPYYNILDTEEDKYNRQQMLKQKQIDMCQGHLWQKIFGCVDDINDLGKGHFTGLDLYSKNRKLFFEIKNSDRSDNSSSRKFKEQLLCDVKKKYPDHTCIYGIVNEETPKKYIKKVNNIEILYVSGNELFKIIFGDQWKEITDFIKICYKKYRPKNQ